MPEKRRPGGTGYSGKSGVWIASPNFLHWNIAFYSIDKRYNNKSLEGHFSIFFFVKKPENIHLAGKKLCGTHDKLTCQCSIGKLLKFYTKKVNFGLSSLWNINFWRKRARIYMTKVTKCTFGGKKTLRHTRQLKKQLWHRKALEILHKKHKFWPAYHVKS